jgi:hypothetical protein
VEKFSAAREGKGTSMERSGDEEEFVYVRRCSMYLLF